MDQFSIQDSFEPLQLEFQKKAPFHSVIQQRDCSTNDNKRQKNNKASFLLVPTIQINLGIKVYGDLLISLDGQIRMCCTLNHVSFGQSKMIGEVVENIKNINCFNIKQKSSHSIQTCDIDDALLVVNRLKEGNKLYPLFEGLKNKIQCFKQEVEFSRQSQKLQKQRDQEFDEFVKYCFQYLKNMNGQNSQSQESSMEQEETFTHDLEFQTPLFSYQSQKEENIYQSTSESQSSNIENSELSNSRISMYAYNIGRLNSNEEDVEIIHQGYSAGYLELLGLDEESLVILALRGKRIDLIRDQEEIFNYSLNGLLGRIIGNSTCEQISNIVTFDGFPLKIFQKTSKICVPNKFEGCFTWKPECLFTITEIDVEISDLENLMKYRKELAVNPNSLSIDTLIQRELSYKFEDIEYSVHSETFIDKYYKENLIALKRLEKREPCKFRTLKKGEYFKQIDVACQ